MSTFALFRLRFAFNFAISAIGQTAVSTVWLAESGVGCRFMGLMGPIGLMGLIKL